MRRNFDLTSQGSNEGMPEYDRFLAHARCKYTGRGGASFTEYEGADCLHFETYPLSRLSCGSWLLKAPVLSLLVVLISLHLRPSPGSQPLTLRLELLNDAGKSWFLVHVGTT